MSHQKIFSWIEFYKDLANAIIKKYRTDSTATEKELRDIMRKGFESDILYMDLDLIIKKWDNKNDFVDRIDPFTFFSNFNRWIKLQKRNEILKDLNSKFDLGYDIVDVDYLTPTVNNKNSWYLTPHTKDVDFKRLWDFFIDWVNWTIKENDFNEILEYAWIWPAKIAIWLFWINPEKYISLDKNTRFYLYNRFKIDFDNKEFDFKKYSEIITNKKLAKDWFEKIVKDAYSVIKTKSDLIKKADELNNELRNVWISVMERLKQISIILFWLYLSEIENLKLIKDELKYDPEEEYSTELINKIFEDIKNETDKNYINEKISAVFSETKLDRNFEKYINDFIKKLDIEILSNVWNYEWDLFWDLYEYFLKTISDAWNLWEFYTPRHIVELLVFILEQKWFNLKNDKIYDPTCGTGGFLSYVWQEFKDKKWDEKNIFWNELNWDTQKFALMNMFLHGDGNSNITQWDSLEKSHIDKIKKIGIKYVIANPPYWAKWLDSNNILWENGYKEYFEKNNILKKDLETKTSELLFLQQIFSVLLPGWTASVIIPEWVNFQSWAAKNIREFLLANCSEFEVFSLPAGAFMPYTWVKTSFYVFTKKTDKSESCKSVKFFDIKNDGYSLDKKRREISWSDIKEIKLRYGTKKWLEELEEKWILYRESVEDLEKNNFSLSIKKEEKVREYKWGMVELWEICELIDWDWIESKNQSNSWIRIIQTGNIWIWKFEYKNKSSRFITRDIFDDLWCTNVFPWDLLISRLPEPIWRSCIIPNDIWDKLVTVVDCTILRPKTKDIFIKYLLYFTNSENYFQQVNNFINGASRERISKENLKKIKIPFPPLEDQKKIVAKLEKLWDLWKLSRDLYQVLENIWVEDEFFESENGKQIPSNNFIEFIRGPFWGSLKKENFIEENHADYWKYKVFEQSNIIKNNFNIWNYFINSEKFDELKRFEVKRHDLLISCSWTVWKIALVPNIFNKWIINQAWLILRLKDVNNSFLNYYLHTKGIRESFFEIKWAWIQNIQSVSDLRNVVFNIPGISIQKQIAKYFHTYSLLKDFVKIFSLDDKNNWNVKVLQNKILESFLLWQENENIDVFLNKIEDIFEEERYFEEEILNKIYYKIIDLVNLDSFQTKTNNDIIKNILNQEWVDQENIEQIILSLDSIKEYWDNSIFEHLRQNLKTVLLQKEFNKWEIYNYELYKQIKSLNKNYLENKKLFKYWTDEDNFEESFIHFNKHVKCIFDTFSKELQTLTQPLSFKFKESRVFPELEKHSSVVLNYLADEIKQNLVFDYSKLKDSATSSKNYIISKDLETISENINKRYFFEKKDIVNYYLSLLTKQFVILYGITGIWKSKIASEFPKHIYWSDVYWNYFKHIAIKAGWDDDKDIKWYYDNLEQDYREWEMLNIIKKAIIDRKNPYFVLLDEMNISKVEHYLSDFLSYIETISQKDNFISENEINLYNTKILDYLEEIKIYLEKLVIQNTFWDKNIEGDSYEKLFDKPEIKQNFYKLLSIESKTWLNLIWDLLENNPIFWVNSLIWSYEDKKILENFIKYIKLQLWENIWEIWDGSIEDYINFIDKNFWDIFKYKDIQLSKGLINKADEIFNVFNNKKEKNVKEFLEIFFVEFTYFLNRRAILEKEIRDLIETKSWLELQKALIYIININLTKNKLNTDLWFLNTSKNIDEFLSFEWRKFFDNTEIEISFLGQLLLKLDSKNRDKNYFSDFIYLSDYNFKKSERSKSTKEEQLMDFKNRLIWKIKEWYSIKLSWSNGENKFKNILSLTLKEIENAKFEIWVRIPDNLYITGTINIDETTEWLSPKVIDRANIIEYNEIHLKEDTYELLDFLAPKENSKTRLELWEIKPFDFKNEAKIYDIKNNIWKEALEKGLKDQIILLKKIYFITQEANQHFWYRAIEEILKYLWNFKIRILEKNHNNKISSIDEYFDLQILQKILPKIGWYNQKTEIILRKILKELLKINSWKDNDKIKELKKIKESIQKVVEKIDSTNIDEIEKTLAEIIDNEKILELKEIKKIIIENDNNTDKQNNKLVEIFIENNKSKLLLLDIIENKILELENSSKTLKLFKFGENYSFDDFNSEKNQISKLDSDYKKSATKIISMLENYYQEGKTSYWA